ncbi:uncharacterized protein LOC121423559 [Lytechinus variegatus]|uniref:uncharacterized protein LOC121423559 n=1 Tax=Lytechinus variegatus TaxID=7654 RepID=UPI001BB0DB97|nr:uncharacterized protein LOC121423559 [Lytechinus variegatus]
MKAVSFLLVSLLLATAVVAGPFGFRLGEEAEPESECSELTRFREGFRYEFDYTTETITGIEGAGPGSTTTMTMACNVAIESPERCKHVLKVTSCHLDGNNQLGEEMSAHDLVFRTENGRIIEVLAHPDEPLHILNAKRGILSMVQLDFEADDVDQITLNEVSVHGNCSSEMNVTKRDERQRPRKLEVVTDLNNCLLRKRPENMTRWQSFKDIVFNTTIMDKFLNSSRTCSYDLKGTTAEFKEIVCEEVHSFWPMNFNSENGVRTFIRQNMLSTAIDNLNTIKVDPAITRSTCLRYEHDPKEVSQKPNDVTADQAMDILKALVKISREEIKMESPRLFGRWRAALEGMTNETIHEVFDRAYNCSEYSQTCRDNPDKEKIAREYLLDGLLPCTTMACFSVKNYAIAKGIIPKPLANVWMVTMALQNYPTLELMSEMLRMAQYSPSQITIFPLSIMVHNYWVNNEEIQTAEELPEPIIKTIRYLKSLIGNDCTVSAENQRLALVALKAIGNIGEPVERYDQLAFIYSERVSPVLIECTKNKQIPSDISKAAIQSMRRFVMSDQLRGRVISELFKDTSLGVPERIASYLITMKATPSVSELTEMWNFLKTEPVKQIKAFCFSHIQNVIESSEPTLQQLKENLKTAMNGEQLPEYPKDIRKYSRFFELSKNLTEPWRNNTVAAQLESGVIFNPESYLPQEVMFHYVLNALGKSWDIFETGIEMKGFEPIVESVFGPEGLFPEVNLQTLFETIDEKFLSKVRGFAEAQLEKWAPQPAESNNEVFNKKDTIGKKMKRQTQIGEPQVLNVIHENTMNKLNQLHYLVGMEPSATDATVFLRLLGNEFGFVSAGDVLSLIPYTMGIYEEFMNKTKQIPQLLSQGLNLNTTRSFVFMDKTFVLPTGMGMPLNCSINGTAVVSLRMKSQFSFNLPKIIAAGHIAPSGAVEVLATMGIGMPTKVFTGVMANATVYHSSKIEGNVTIDGTHLKINLNNTDRPMNLFNYSTTYNLMKANGEIEYIPGVLQDAVRNQRCTNVSRVFGVDLCVSWAYPNASYVAEAPRFPFTGPNSFNVTLVNTDQALKAYTIDAQYKQIRKGGAPSPITFSSIGRRNNRNTPETSNIIDTVRVSFYAPGEELTRNITSLMSVDRLRKTAKWTFTVPEVKNFIMFAGLLNETTDSSSTYRAVFNVSAAENTASVDFLVRNETSVSQKNLTAVFNASINNLYWAAVGQFVKQAESGDWNAHVTDTYYWDDETPLYKQILFPWTGYQINHAKYQTSTIAAKRITRGPVVQRDLKMSTLGWALDFDTVQTVRDELKEIIVHTKISNSSWEFPLLDFILRNETKVNGYRLEGQVARNTHHVFAEYDFTKEQRETNRNFRMGLRTDVFVNNPDAAMFLNSPALLRLFGETALIDEPVVIDGGMNFRILDQSSLTEEHLIQTSIFVPSPRNPQTHLTYDFDLRFENATISNQKDFSVELTTPIPLLKLNNVNLLHLVIDMESGASSLAHTYTLYDTRYSKPQVTVSNIIAAGWKKPSANWVMDIETPSMVFYQNYTALYSRENGLQCFYENSQDSSFSDLLDFTEISNLSVRPSAVSLYWSYLHQLLSTNVSNSLAVEGPITEMRLRVVPLVVRDILNRTYNRDFQIVKNLILNKFIFNVTSSSLTLRQSANISSPVFANMSASHYIFLSRNLFDQQLTFVAEQKRLNISAGLNHSLLIEGREVTLKTEGGLTVRTALRMNTLTSVNVTVLKEDTPFDLAALHHTEVDSPLIKFSTRSSSNGDFHGVLNMVANHITSMTSRLGSFDVIGNFDIHDMTSPTQFSEMTGILTYNLQSRMIKSSLNSSVSFQTFRKLFKFSKILVKASQDIKSNWVNWNVHGKSQLKGFSSIFEFDEVSSSVEANLLNKFVNGSHSSGIALRDMNGLLVFGQFATHLSNNITSRFVNSTYQTQMNLESSDASFTTLDGSSNYILSSCLLNVTANNTLLMNGFRRLFNFDNITGKQIWFVKTALLNATMDNHIALTDFQNASYFEEIAGHVSGNVEFYLARGNTNTTLLVQNVRSFTQVSKVAVDSSSTFTSRLMNSSLIGGMDISNHRSLFNFDSISSRMNFTSKVFSVSTSMQNEVSFNGVRSFVNFDTIAHNFGMVAKSPYFDSSLTEVISLENFRKFNQFDLASAEVIASFNTILLNTSYHQIHKVQDMAGWFQYPLAETVIIGNLTTSKLNVSGLYEGRIIDMTAPFQYASSIAKVEYGVNNRFLNIEGIHGVEVDNMRSVFDFTRINGTISHAVTTPITRMSVGGLLEMNNFQRLFAFDLMNVTTSNIFIITPLRTTFAAYNGGLALQGFEKFNKFESITGKSKGAVLTKWTNWTMNVDSTFAGVRSFLDFDQLDITGQNEFTSPFLVITSNTTNFVTGSNGFFKASNATTKSMFGLISRIGKIDSGATWSVRDVAGPLTFAANVFSTNVNISTPFMKTGSKFDVEMENWENITTFGKYEVSAVNDIQSRIATWNVLSHFKLANMAGILTYSRMEGCASSNFSSIILSLYTSFNGHINSQAGPLNYEEMVIVTQGNFSSWPIKMQGGTQFNVQNMAGFMTYDSIIGSASGDITSRFLNTTAQSSLTANIGTGLFKVQLANVSSALTVNTPFTREIKASSSAQVTDSRNLFKFGNAAIKGEFSFLTSKINVTGNADSTLINFENITTFESVESTAVFDVASRFLNSSSRGIMQMHGFERLFRFSDVKIGGLTEIKSILANLTTEAGIDFSNFQSIFTFKRVNSSALVSFKSRLATIDSKTGMEMNNFRGVMAFDRVNGSLITDFNSKLINSTSLADFALEGFESLFTFTRVAASAESVINNKIFNSSVVADFSVSDSTCFCKFGKLVAQSTGSFTSRFATGRALGIVEVKNVRKLTSFDLVNVTSEARFISRPMTAMTETIYTIKNHRSLFNFDQVRSRIYGNIQSKWVNSSTLFESQMNNSQSLLVFDSATSRLYSNVFNSWIESSAVFEYQMNNSRNILNFDAAKSKVTFTLRTLVNDAHFSGELNFINFANITHYGEVSAMAVGNITSPFVRAAGITKVNVTNMAGIMSFEKALIDSYANVESRFINTTLQNSVVFKGFKGITYSYIGHRLVLLWVDPINDVTVKNGLDLTTLKDMSQLFNITWANPKGTVVFNQRLNYENLVATIKLPSIGLISAGANLNTFGDSLTFYIDHELLKDNFKTVNDITWLLRLNESNVIYSNFSWNPQTVAEIVDITVGTINSHYNRTITIAKSTINRVMEVANRTLTHTRRMTNCTKCFMRYTIMLANETLTSAFSQLNQTAFTQALKLNETLFIQLKKMNQTFYTQLRALNQTFCTQMQKLKETITYARSNPREFISQYVNLTKLNETVTRINATIRELYAKLRYNITHPRETIENIKILIKYEERLEQIMWVLENREILKTRAKNYLIEMKANITKKAKAAVDDFKELIQYEARVEKLYNYIQTRFNVPKFQEKIMELKVKLGEIKEKMAELKMRIGERLNELKMSIASLDKEMVKAEIKAQLIKAKKFIAYYLNSTTIDSISSSIFINYKDDAQVQELMRKVIRIRPRNVIDIINKTSVMETKNLAMEAKENMIIQLELLNQTTFRYVNKTYLNETIKQATEMLKEWNSILNEYVYVNVIKEDMKLVLNITKEKVVNMTRAANLFIKSKADLIKAFLEEQWDARPRSLEELKERLMEIKTIAADYISERYNIDVDQIIVRVIDEYKNRTQQIDEIIVRMGNEYMKRKEQIDEVINKIIAISKNESHPVNMLPLCYFNRTIYQIVQPPVDMTRNLTVLYSKMAANLTKVYSKKVADNIEIYSMMVVNQTKVYSRIALDKMKDLGKKYTPIVMTEMKKYKSIALEKGKIVKDTSIMYFNIAKGNATLFFQNYSPIVNKTICIFIQDAKQRLFNFTLQVRSKTDHFINMSIEFLEPHVQRYRERIYSANMMEQVRQLPTKTEAYLMEAAEYHIERYPEYKQKTIQNIDDMKIKLEELKVNLTRFYQEVKANTTRMLEELKENTQELYNKTKEKALNMYDIRKDQFKALKLQVQDKWHEWQPVILKNMEINGTVQAIISATKDEYSLINELPMRLMERTVFELGQDLRAYINQLAEELVETVRMSIKDRTSLLNKYPVKYLDMTIFEVGNITYGKILVASNLTKFYANSTLARINFSLVMVNKTFYDVLNVSNTKLREVVLPILNQTARDIMIFINRTRSQPWRVTINETMCFLNRTSAILKNKANETFIIFQAKVMEAWKNLTSEESIAKMKMYLNNTKDQIIRSLKVANETIYMIRNRSINLVIYVRDETRLLNLSKEYALLAKDLTKNSIYQARNITVQTINYVRNMTNTIVTYIQGPAKDFTMEYVTYVNNTMAGWAIRYYEVDQFPSKASAYIAAIKPVERTINLTMIALNQTRLLTELAFNRSKDMTRYALNETIVMTQYALNQTRIITRQAIKNANILTWQAVNRTRTLIRDTLNSIGRLDDHSFAMNISHPFNWTSFRSLPRLSNNQIQYIKEKMAQLNVTLQEIRVNMTERYHNYSRMVKDYYQLQKPMIDEKIEPFLTKLRQYRTTIQEKIDEYQEKKDQILTSWREEIKPKINEMINNLTNFIKDPELLTNLKQMVLQFMTETLPEWKRVIFEEKYPVLKGEIVEKYSEIKVEVITQYEIAKEIFEELKFNDTIFRQKAMTKVESLKTKALEKWNELLQKIQDIKQAWPETYKKIKADIEAVTVDLKTKLSGYINKILTLLQDLRIPVELLPLEHIKIYSPWKYTAMIFGENHVMTFDGKVYSVPAYADEVQTYVLAHDYIDRNFTLLVQKKRVTLVIRNTSVAIDDENVVHVNGLPNLQELPYQTPISKEVTIMAKGPWVNVTSTKGIALSCHVDHFICIFHLSGWYHGKSRGLFGNLDTEHHNDFILPEGGITTDVAEFISAYDVSPYISRNVVPSQFGACPSNDDECRDRFLDEDSTLNATFRDINQVEFYNFCVKETSKCHTVCEATNPVATLGMHLLRNVTYEQNCLDCTPGEISQENRRSTSTADIIFVVSETVAMAEDNNIKSSMKHVINEMDRKLQNINDVRYGISAYGGADIHGRPHVHTLCGHLMDSSLDCASSGVESLVFEGAMPGDAMGAIQLAASYPFRKEAAKIIILIADEDIMEESTNYIEYLLKINNSRTAIQKRLERQGITFNVFSSYPTLNKKSTDSPILGVDYLGTQIINKKNSAEEGTSRLAIPSGQYAKLAKATRGSVLGLRWLQTGHRDLNNMLPKLILSQIEPQASGQVDFTCRCVIGMYGESRNECQISRYADL